MLNDKKKAFNHSSKIIRKMDCLNNSTRSAQELAAAKEIILKARKMSERGLPSEALALLRKGR